MHTFDATEKLAHAQKTIRPARPPSLPPSLPLSLPPSVLPKQRRSHSYRDCRAASPGTWLYDALPVEGSSTFFQ
jgi:hypothetical protein